MKRPNGRILSLVALGIVVVLLALTIPPGEPASAQTGISIVNFNFSPANVAVKQGASVSWTNNGSATHTTTSATGAWDSGNLAPAAGFSRTFNDTGVFPFFCRIHPSMVGAITVESASGATATPITPAIPTRTPTSPPAAATATPTPTSPPAAATATSTQPAAATATATATTGGASPSAASSASASPAATSSASPSRSASPAAAGSTTPGAPGSTASSVGSRPPATDDGDDDGGVPLYVWGVLAGGALLILGGLFAFLRRRSPDSDGMVGGPPNRDDE